MLLKELQRIRNLSRLTIKQDKDYMNKFIPAAMEYSDFKLKEMMSFHAELDKNTAEIDKALKEAETLPKHLYEEVFEHPRPYEFIRPDTLDELDRHFDEYVRYLPEDMAQNFKVARHLRRIGADLIPHHEE